MAPTGHSSAHCRGHGGGWPRGQTACGPAALAEQCKPCKTSHAVPHQPIPTWPHEMHLLRSRGPPPSTAGWRPRDRPDMPSTSMPCEQHRKARDTQGYARAAGLLGTPRGAPCTGRRLLARSAGEATWMASQAVTQRPHFRHLRMVGPCIPQAFLPGKQCHVKGRGLRRAPRTALSLAQTRLTFQSRWKWRRWTSRGAPRPQPAPPHPTRGCTAGPHGVAGWPWRVPAAHPAVQLPPAAGIRLGCQGLPVLAQLWQRAAGEVPVHVVPQSEVLELAPPAHVASLEGRR